MNCDRLLTDISMRNVPFVECLQSLTNHLDDAASLSLVEVYFSLADNEFLHQVSKTTILGVLSYDILACVVSKDVNQFDDSFAFEDETERIYFICHEFLINLWLLS